MAFDWRVWVLQVARLVLAAAVTGLLAGLAVVPVMFLTDRLEPPVLSAIPYLCCCAPLVLSAYFLLNVMRPRAFLAFSTTIVAAGLAAPAMIYYFGAARETVVVTSVDKARSGWDVAVSRAGTGEELGLLRGWEPGERSVGEQLEVHVLPADWSRSWSEPLYEPLYLPGLPVWALATTTVAGLALLAWLMLLAPQPSYHVPWPTTLLLDAWRYRRRRRGAGQSRTGRAVPSGGSSATDGGSGSEDGGG